MKLNMKKMVLLSGMLIMTGQNQSNAKMTTIVQILNTMSILALCATTHMLSKRVSSLEEQKNLVNKKYIDRN